MLGYTGETNVQGEQVQKLDAVRQRGAHAPCSSGAGAARWSRAKSSRGQRAHRRDGQVHRPASTRSTARATSTSTSRIGTIFCAPARARTRAAAPAPRARSSPGHEIVGRGLRRLRQRDDAPPLDRARRPRLHARPERRRVLPLAPEHPLPRARQLRTRSTRATSSRWDDPVKKWNAWIKSEDKAAGPARTGTATSARSSPTRTARS